MFHTYSILDHALFICQNQDQNNESYFDLVFFLDYYPDEQPKQSQYCKDFIVRSRLICYEVNPSDLSRLGSSLNMKTYTWHYDHQVISAYVLCVSRSFARLETSINSLMILSLWSELWSGIRQILSNMCTNWKTCFIWTL
jgi:hypothetical protein